MENNLIKKKPRKKKIILLTIGMIFVFVVAYSMFGYSNYKQEIKDVEEQVINDFVKENNLVEAKVDSSIKNPLTSVNPRRSFLNSSDDEVICLDHEGNIHAIGNLTFTTGDVGYGFFSYVGSSISRVTKGWFTDIDVSGTVNASYINTTNIQSTDWTNTTITESQVSDLQSYLTSYTETDPIWEGNYSIFTGLISNASYLSTYNSTYDGLISNASYLSTYNLTYDGLISNSSYLSTYNATYDAQAGNLSWNESHARTIFYDEESDLTGLLDDNYAGIEWDYNQTTATFNTYGKWWYNQTTATYNIYNDAWTSTYNSTYDGLISNWSYLSTYNSTYDGLISNASYLSTYNATYNAYTDTNASSICSGTTTYLDGEGNCDDISSVYYDAISDIPNATPSDGDTTHFSLADEIYDWVIGLLYITTANADTAFINASGDSMTGNLNFTDNNATGVDFIKFTDGGYLYDNSTALIFGHN